MTEKEWCTYICRFYKNGCKINNDCTEEQIRQCFAENPQYFERVN